MRNALLRAWRFVLCETFGHHPGEASDLGLVPGVVCYRCGHRLHACHRERRHGR